MPTLVSPAIVRQHVETDLGDGALQRLIDDADATIVDRYGPHAGNLTLDTEGDGGALLFVDRPAGTIVSVTEYVIRQENVGVLLDPADWRALDGGHRLERLTSGPNARTTWGERVVVVYAPSDEGARRTMMEIDLVRLAASYEPYDETVGDWAARRREYEAERQAILGRMRRRRMPFA